MKIFFFWNIRGIGNNDSRIAFRDNCHLNTPSLVFIGEPMVLYDSIHAFKNHSAIPMRFRNRWHNCLQLGLFVICSHIYREGNCCADALASLGHELPDTTWFHIMPVSLSIDFNKDRNGLPNYILP